MQRVPIPKKARTPYWLRFSLVMFGFGGFTSAFVMVVLPKRFILQSGLVESGVTFPTQLLPFQSSGRHSVVQPVYSATSVTGSGVGPAEQFWADALPYLESDNPEGALPVFADYLDRFPEDYDVWREYAVTLRRANEYAQAEEVYERLIAAGDVRARLDLARLRRDQGDMERAIPVYQELAEEDPDNLEILHELALSLAWAEYYEEATGRYRQLSARDPCSLAYRLELAQLLYWQGLMYEAFDLLATYPSSDSGWYEAEQMLTQMVPYLAPTAPSLAEMIQRAVAQGDFPLATLLFRRLLARKPRDSDVWREWVDFLQYDLRNLEATREQLMDRKALVGLDSESRFRLAQLHLWTRHEDEAKAELLELLNGTPDHASGWALLGDLHRWDGDRLAARDAYQRALSLSPGHEEAQDGLRGIHDQVDLMLAERDPAGVEPKWMFFQDSDDYRRLDYSVRAATRLRTTSLILHTGYRHLDGPGLGGTASVEQGPFAQLEVVQWWRLGTVRTSIAAGVERFTTFGTEPALSARVEIPDANGYALQAAWDHGAAYAHTVTLASMIGGVRSDNFSVAAYRSLNDRFSLAGNANVVSLRAGGSGSLRGGVAATATGRVVNGVTVGLSSWFLGHTEAAPSLDTRRLYWDPSAFWTNSLLLELRSSDESDWILFGRVSPGFALARERDLAGTSLVPQFGTEAGASYESDRISFGSDLAYYRGREGDYSSFLVNLRFTVKP